MGCCNGRPVKKAENNNQSTDSASKDENAEMGLKVPPNLRKSSNSLYKSHNSLQNYSSKNILNKTEELLLINRKALDASEETKNLQNAKEKNDLPTIVDYFTSQIAMPIEVVILPEWAEHPKTVGSLALVYAGLFYASISSMEAGSIESARKKANDVLIKKRVEKIFVKNLKSPELDRNELTILLLVIILEENPKLQEYLFINGVFQPLVDFLGPLNPVTKKVSKQELRLGALQAVREFLRDHPKYCEEFCKGGHLEFIKKMLEDPQDIVVFEGLIFIDELTTENTTLNTRNLKLMSKLTELGFSEKLKKVVEAMSKPLPASKQTDPDAVEIRENSKKYAKFLLENLAAYSSLN